MTKKKASEAERLVISARTPNQKRYLQLLGGSVDIIFSEGPAGTGKTYLAVHHAVEKLRCGDIEKIVITRPNVDAGDPLGHLPGDLNEKMTPWMLPILDVLHEVYTVAEVRRMLAERIIEIAPLAFMRGRTFKNAAIIGDEMQNTTPEQMIMFLTRIGVGSRIVCTGDLKQHDRGHSRSGLVDALERFERRPSDRVASCHFDIGDVQRHEVIPHVLRAYE